MTINQLTVVHCCMRNNRNADRCLQIRSHLGQLIVFVEEIGDVIHLVGERRKGSEGDWRRRLIITTLWGKLRKG